MTILEFILARLASVKSTDFEFAYWSPNYIFHNPEGCVYVDMNKDTYLIAALVTKDYEKALGVLSHCRSTFDWWDNSSVSVFDVDDKAKIVSLRPGHGFAGLNHKEWRLLYLTSAATMLYACLKADENYRAELELGKGSNNLIIKKFFSLIDKKLPEYNVEKPGTYVVFFNTPGTAVSRVTQVAN